MHPDPGFHPRLAAQSYRFLQKHPRAEHLEVVVITPHQRHKLGPARLPRQLQLFLGEVHWISLEALSRQPDLDPLLNLLTLPVRHEAELPACSQQNADATVSGAEQGGHLVIPASPTKNSGTHVLPRTGSPRAAIRKPPASLSVSSPAAAAP